MSIVAPSRSAERAPVRGRRRARHLHAVRSPRPLPGRHDGPRCRALAGRRHRLGLRRARDLRALPGDAGHRRVPQARDRLAAREPVGASPSSRRHTARRRVSPTDRRLSCTATVLGDVLIDVPPESQVHRQVVRKGLDVRTFIVDPVVRLHYVEVTPPELASPTGDLARLFEALEREWAADRVSRRTSRSSAPSSPRSRPGSTA